MKLTIFVIHPGFCRFFEVPIRKLLEKKHQITLVFSSLKRTATGFEGQAILNSLQEYPNLKVLLPSDLPEDLLGSQGIQKFKYSIRSLFDYTRYFHPDYRNTRDLQLRAKKAVEPQWLGETAETLLKSLGNGFGVFLRSVIKIIERFIRAPSGLQKLIADLDPDCVVMSPYIDLGSEQVDIAKAARNLSIPTVHWVASWDNLTNKGLIKTKPDYVLVWNQFQIKEAEKYHGMDSKRVIEVGASSLEKWFVQKPNSNRSEFLKMVGLPENKKYILYLGSSPFIARDEVTFFKRWYSALSQDPQLREFSVLVRPHPQNYKQWAQLDGRDGLAVYPRTGEFVVTKEAEKVFFDTLYHADAIVGVNTSAMIEANILGKPVFTIQAEEFKGTQEGTLHFSYLLDLDFAVSASDLEKHIKQLQEIGSTDFIERQRRAAKNIRSFLWRESMPAPSDQIVSFFEKVSDSKGREINV